MLMSGTAQTRGGNPPFALRPRPGRGAASSDEPEGGAVGVGVVRCLDASGYLPAGDNGALATAEKWAPLDALR